MTVRLSIDMVSDVSCPWCVIGLFALEHACKSLARDDIAVDIHFQPFELNPSLPPEGQDLTVYLVEKYGMTAEQLDENRRRLEARGQEVGFAFDLDKRTRTYNTFDAHRLLHWAGLEGRELALKHALFEAYFIRGENPGAPDTLLRSAVKAGLDAIRAEEVVSTDAYAAEVRERQEFYRRQGIRSVPAVIVNQRHVIEGGQPSQLFERVLREIAARA